MFIIERVEIEAERRKSEARPFEATSMNFAHDSRDRFEEGFSPSSRRTSSKRIDGFTRDAETLACPFIFFNSLNSPPPPQYTAYSPLRTPATPPLVRIFTSVFTPHLQSRHAGLTLCNDPFLSLSLSLPFPSSALFLPLLHNRTRIYVGARTALILTLILALIYPWSGYAFACIKSYTMRLYQHGRGAVSRSLCTVWIQYQGVSRTCGYTGWARNISELLFVSIISGNWKLCDIGRNCRVVC